MLANSGCCPVLPVRAAEWSQSHSHNRWSHYIDGGVPDRRARQPNPAELAMNMTKHLSRLRPLLVLATRHAFLLSVPLGLHLNTICSSIAIIEWLAIEFSIQKPLQLFNVIQINI